MKRMIAFVIVAMLVFGGCSADTDTTPSPPPTDADEVPLLRVPGAYVGRAQGSEVFVAIVPGGDRLRVYACDGEDLVNATVDQWFGGAFDGTGPATLQAGGLTVTVERTADGFAGDLVLGDGTTLPYTATKESTDVALFDAEFRDPVTGAISRDGNVIMIGDELRGVMADPRPRKCRPVQVTLADGTTSIVTVCKMV